ncbi:MAG: hypothetical protein L6365_17510 [Desulfobulbaceae bacterium]|nr:hypothetical protein [Pseudomonadota bacterium]MCG2749314.1 hypothetical protein [Desulfobulbaceae bacterium]
MGRQLLRQMGDVDKSHAAHDESAFNNICQFPHIAWSVVRHDQGEGLGSNVLDLFALQSVEYAYDSQGRRVKKTADGMTPVMSII